VLAFKAIPKYRDNVYDPDPEKSYTKAKLQRHLGNDKETVADNLSISSSAENPEVLFPTDEVANLVFNNNFSVLTNFVPMDVFQHIKNSGKSIKKYDNVDVVVNSNDKGLRMMRFLHDLQVYKDPQKNYVFVRACCWASYKRDRKYKIKLTVQGGRTCTDKIKSASCDRQCPASKSECCCHVMAVIWKLEDMTRKGDLKECDNRTCTSKPQQWGKEGKREVNCSPVMTTSIVKPRHASDGPGKRKRGIHSQFYDPRPVKSRKIDPDSIIKLKENLQEINPKLPLALMLPEDRNIPTVNTLIGPVARGSVLHKQLQGFQMGSTNPVTSCDPISYQSPNPAMNGSSNESGHVPTQTNSNVTDGHFTNHSENSTDSQLRHTPIEPECLNNSSPSHGFTNFPLLPNKCCEETVYLNLFSNATTILNKVQVSFKQYRSFMPRQLVKQITMYGMKRENTASQPKSLAKF